jgi:PAS domain S-box-containing protein
MDITERKQAQEALRQSEERLRLITDAMSDSVGQVDGNGRLQYMSRAFEAWTGQDASTLMQEAILGWSKFIHPDDLGSMATLFSTLSDADRPVRMDHRVLAADGSILWFETVANVLREADGGFGGAIFVSRNIDERRQAEKNALELAAERKMVAALRNILSNVSHDFRTPISVINSSMYLLRRKAGEDFPGLRHLIAIEDQTERMANMVETMFTVSYLEDDDYLLSPVEVTGLVRNVLVRRQESAARKKLLLVNNMPAVPVYTMAEAVMLNRAVDSLLLNALQYTPEGGSITVNGHVQADRVVIEVVDTGMGISAKDLPHIFESFYRADKARNIDHGSTGLGLTIAQRIIQRHSGMIEVECEPDAGSTFRIILPLLKDGEQQQP